MKKYRYIIAVMFVLPFFGGTLFSQNANSGGAERGNRGDNADMRPVDLKSRRMMPVQVGDSTGYALTGDVVLFHNGAVITCDSLVRYSDRQMACFGSVVINKDSTYVYGDRAEYDGDNDMAQVFSPLVKVRNGNASLYTYGFKFNTKSNVGEFFGGGTLLQETNRMEADRGYYYSDTRDVVGVNSVELKNDKYMMKSDSVRYNMDSEVASFFNRSVIWNDRDEILSAERGEYSNKEDRYRFGTEAYILTEDMEVWADSIDYAATAQDVEMWRDVQVNNSKDRVMAFGNHAKYTGATGDGFLTEEPLLLSYDSVKVDTIFMSMDSVFVFLVDSLGQSTLTRKDSARLAVESLQPKKAAEALPDEELISVAEVETPALSTSDIPVSEVPEGATPDSVAEEIVQADTVKRTDRIMLGRGNVKIFRSDFQAVCDSLLGFTVDSTLQMHINPVVWNGDNQIVSVRVDVETKNQKPLKAVFSGGSPIMSSKLDTSRYNQVAGKTIYAHFNDGAIYRSDAVGNALVYYYMTDNSDGAVTGFARIDCSDISFNIADNQVESIVFRSQPDYVFYPPSKIPADQPQTLPEFVWHGDRRPSRDDVFKKSINPSERDSYQTLQKPLFPITYSIDNHRTALVESGTWVDREDEISEQTREFMETREPY